MKKQERSYIRFTPQLMVIKLKLLLPIILVIITLAIVFAVIILNTETLPVTNNISQDTVGLKGIISIGTLLPLTGEISQQAEERRLATELAVNDFNDYLNNNNASWNLKMVYEDSKANPVTALEKLESLYTQNIRIVSGPSTSGELKNIINYANTNDMLLFSPASTAPSLAIPGDNVYRLTPDDTKQGPALAAMIKFHGINSIIQVVRDDTWGNGLAESIEGSFLSDDTTTSQIIRYNPESPKFSATISQLSQAVSKQVAIHGADNVGVVMIGFAETFYFLESAAQYDTLDDILWFGSDGSAKEESLVSDSVVAAFADSVQYTSTLISISNNEIHTDINNRIIEKLGRTPNTYAFSVYDIVWILGLAMDEADSSDVSDVTPIIADIASKYTGAIGNTTLNAAGDLDSSSYDVWEIYLEQWVKIGYYNSEDGSFDDKHNDDKHNDDKHDNEKHDTIIDLENNIKDIVNKTINQYDGDLSTVTDLEFGDYYSFVLSGNLDEILVHPNGKVIGEYPVGINEGNISTDTIIKTLNTSEGVWVDYVYPNPVTGIEESKRSWLVLHEGYVFSAGYYNP